MKNVGILTFYKSINYGSVLQAYALQQAIDELGYHSEIIDYEPNNYDYLYANFRKINSFDDIRYNLGNLLYLKVLNCSKQLFQDFRMHYLNSTKDSYHYGMSLENLNSRFDFLVCGSDQIWNPKAKDSDVNYFLPIEPIAKKISYAVSINDGSIEDQVDADKYNGYLLGFDFLSVRENSAKAALEKFLNREVKVTIDPTLLYFREKYDLICSPCVVQCPYIFFYSIGYSFSAVEAVAKIAERTGLKVCVLYTGRGTKRVLRKYRNFELIKKKTSPCDFLSLIKYADYVITDSFHGTAFAIIYEKKFFSVGQTDDNGEKLRDERICDILEKLNIMERFISESEAKIIDLNLPIDYHAVNVKRNALKEDSRNYLLTAMQ